MNAQFFKSTPFLIASTICLVAILGIIDYATGFELNFFVFYFIPVSIAAWYVGRKWAVVIAVLSAITWTAVDFLSGHRYSHWSLYAWNGGIRLAAFVILGVALATIKKLLEIEKELSRSIWATLEEVKMLKGFLPICSSCKNIRDDRGYWEKIELYIEQHSDAEFTHTLCPDCMKKLYPDINSE
jgi:K+-sensing histidine kinase KdpD